MPPTAPDPDSDSDPDPDPVGNAAEPDGAGHPGHSGDPGEPGEAGGAPGRGLPDDEQGGDPTCWAGLIDDQRDHPSG